jgi:hypothetical protein
MAKIIKTQLNGQKPIAEPEQISTEHPSPKLGLIQRLKAPTPSFFRKVRNTGLVIAALSAALLTSPVALPLFITTTAGYLAVAGGVLTAVSQATVPVDLQ